MGVPIGLAKRSRSDEDAQVSMTEPLVPSPPLIRAGSTSDVPYLAEAFRQMWLDNATPPERIEADYRERVARFVADGEREAMLTFFVAERAAHSP